MNRIEEKDILNIIKQINDEFLQEDSPMSFYECFDFDKKDNNKIAKHLSKAINLNCNCDEEILNNMINTIAYTGSVVPSIIIDKLYRQKKLNKNKYKSLLKWADDAWFVYRIHHIPITEKELKEYLGKSNYSITKQRVKDVIHMLYVDE